MREYRADFAVYRNNPDLCYLDYAATTFMPDSVIDAWINFHQHYGISIGRGSNYLSAKANRIFEESSMKILDFFHATKKYQLIYTKNATESANLLASILVNMINPGDIIVTTEYEHHSNLLPWIKLASDKDAIVLKLPILPNGNIDYDFIERSLYDKIKIITVTMESNVNSYTPQIEKIKLLKKETNAILVFDMSQVVGHSKVDCGSIDADAYFMSAHKMYGPKNIGGLLMKNDICEELPPFMLGGGMVWSSLGGKPTWYKDFRRYMAGTFDVGLVFAWAKACEYMKEIGMTQIASSDFNLKSYLKESVAHLHRFCLIPEGTEHGYSLSSFTLDGIHSHDVAALLSEEHIVIRTGHMCAQPTLQAFHQESICRVSWGIGTDVSDVDRFIDAISERVNNRK